MWYDAQSNGWTGSGSERHSQNWNSSTQSLSGGSQPDYSHITSFTGASTGNMFNVGQSYSLGGDVVVANSNGTFTNQRTGNTLEGSATNPDAKFYGYASLASSGGGGSGPASEVVATASGGAGAGPGSPVANTGTPQAAPSASPAGIGPGAPAAVSRAASDRSSGLRLEIDKPAKVTQVVIQGHPVDHDDTWSNAAEAEDRWGEGELLSPTWFYQWGVAGADFDKALQNTARHVNQTYVQPFYDFQEKLNQRVVVPTDEAGWAPRW